MMQYFLSYNLQLHHHNITSQLEVLYQLKSTLLKQFIIFYIYTSKVKEMQVIQQIAAVVPFGEEALHKVQGAYEYSKDKTVSVYNKTKGKVVETRKGYLEFRSNLQQTFTNIIQQTVNEVLLRIERIAGVQKDSKSAQDLKHARQRLQTIFQSLFREYILRSRLVTNEKVQQLLKMGKKYSIQYLVPLYINLRATLIVSKEMLIQFLESRLNEIKMTYESGKDNVVMFIGGNFNEDNLKNKVFQGIDSFRKFTVRVVNKGLEIKVDRKSLVENYDKFAVNFLQVVKEMRQKSEDNIIEMKKKSKDLYKEVINRIRAKQLEIKTALREQMPCLTETSS